MSLDPTFGNWNHPAMHWSQEDSDLQALWHTLAAQMDEHGAVTHPNFGMSQRKHEICLLWKLFQWRKPKVIVEVGVSQGGTFASWCQLADNDAILIAIDRDLNDSRPRPNEPVPSRYSGHSKLLLSQDGGGIYHLARGNQRVIGITGWTTSPSTREELSLVLAGRKIDFLFHDASHSKEMFYRDFQWLWPIMGSGGIFAAQDIQESIVPQCDKSIAWDRIKKEEAYSALLEFKGSRTDDSMGIGILFKP